MATASPFMDLLGNLGLGTTRGQLSAYQNNGPLNGLVHVLVADIDKLSNPPHIGNTAAARQELLNAFAAEHQVYLTWNDFKQVAKDLTPIQREVVLGPVLRKLVADPRQHTLQPPPVGWAAITVEETATLASRFDIKVEGYLTPDAFKAKLAREIKAADVEAAYTIEEPIEIERLRLAAGLGAVATPLTPGQQATLRAKISQELSTPRYALDLQQRVETEFTMRQALPTGNPNRPDMNQIRRDVPVAQRMATLKLWQSEEGQYQFDVTNPAAHNSSFISHSFVSYETQAADITKVVNDAVLNRTATKPIAIKKAFQQFETAEAKKPGVFANNMQNQLQTVLLGITNMLGFGDKNGPAAFIGKIFSGIIGALFQMLGPLSNMKQMFSNLGKTPDASLTSDAAEMKALQETDPQLAAERREFASLVEKLVEQGATEEAGRLNEAWRATPNTPAVWKDLAVTMIDHGLNDDIDSWMKAKSKKTLDDLIREEQKIERASQHPNTPTLLHIELNRIQAAFNKLNNPKLAQATDAYKVENLTLRMKMFEKLMEVATNVMATEEERKKATADLAQLRQNLVNLTASHTAAAGQPIAAALQQRLAVVTAALQATAPVPSREANAVQAAQQAKAAAMAGPTGLPAIVPMFTRAHKRSLETAIQRIDQETAARLNIPRN